MSALAAFYIPGCQPRQLPASRRQPNTYNTVQLHSNKSSGEVKGPLLTLSITLLDVLHALASLGSFQEAERYLISFGHIDLLALICQYGNGGHRRVLIKAYRACMSLSYFHLA